MQRLATNADTLRDALAAEGFEASESTTQIVPLVIGDAAQAVAVSEAALERGVFAQAIRPPTVPEQTSRLRLAVMATHRERELREAARTIAAAAHAVGVDLRSGLQAAPATVAAVPERHEATVIPATTPATVFDVDAAPTRRAA
jgi:hypothetical protein